MKYSRGDLFARKYPNTHPEDIIVILRIYGGDGLYEGWHQGTNRSFFYSDAYLESFYSLTTRVFVDEI